MVATDKKYIVLEEINHPQFTLLMRSDGIVQMNTSENAYFTVNDAKEYIKLLGQITKGVPHLVIKVPGKHASVDTETRLYMAKPEALQFSIAEAVIIRNLAQRIIGNFYIKFDKPNKPVRLFEKIEEAEKWLKRFY